jgi:GDP-mannose 4,6-dehydratase
LINSSSLVRIVPQVKPDEIYSLAVQSDVAVSFEELEYTANSDALGTLRLLEAIRILGLEKKTRFYRASTSEVLGKVQEIPQRETTPLLRGRIPRARAPRVTLTAAGACRGSTDLFIAERDILPSPELQ